MFQLQESRKSKVARNKQNTYLPNSCTIIAFNKFWLQLSLSAHLTREVPTNLWHLHSWRGILLQGVVMKKQAKKHARRVYLPYFGLFSMKIIPTSMLKIRKSRWQLMALRLSDLSGSHTLTAILNGLSPNRHSCFAGRLLIVRRIRNEL